MRENLHEMSAEDIANLMQRDQYHGADRRNELWQAFQNARAREDAATRVVQPPAETMLEREHREAFTNQSAADRLMNDLMHGGAQHKAEIANANRTAAIARAVLAPKPSTADLATEALARITASTKAVRQGATSELKQIVNNTDMGDAA